jgi:hypothetical protein
MRRRLCWTLLLAACDRADEGGEKQPQPTTVVAPDVLYLLPNVDNEGDFSEAPSEDDDELEPLTVQLSGLAAASLRLDVDGSDQLRVWRDGAVLVDDWNEAVTIDWVDGDLELAVEAGQYDVDGSLVIDALDDDGEIVVSATVRLRSAPLLLSHHLQPGEKVVATEVAYYGSSNEAMLAVFSDVLGDAFEAANGRDYQQDAWIQDEVEFAYATLPDGRSMPAIIDSIRDRGLDDYAEDRWRGEDFAHLVFGRGYANSLDSFGNLELTPPVDGFPFGRIYYGAVDGYAPRAKPLFTFFDEVGLQAPIQIDTSWLCVGHVDEFMTFLPDPTAPRGFRYVIADVDAAWAVLDAMDPSTPLPRYAGRQNHDYATVGEIVADAGLRSLNDDLMRERIEPMLTLMTAELGLQSEEILRLPSLFEDVGYCGGTVASLIPGMVNLTIADLGDGPQAFLPDPFLRADLDDQTTDPMIDAVTELLPESIDLHFVDDWEIYHLALGEVHCGSNVLRSPSAADWWTQDLGGSQ